MKGKPPSRLYRRLQKILESARTNVARSVNTSQVVANWLIGRELVEEDQKGRRRAAYGEGLLRKIADRLQDEYGSGYNLTNLKLFKKFYLEYQGLVDTPIGHSVRDLSTGPGLADHVRRGQTLIDNPLPGESWLPGILHPNLSWTHYRTLLRVEKPEARAFYEIEAIQNGWSSRELGRQVNSLLFERLAKSKDKKGLLRMALKGQEIRFPDEVFKDPFVIEFLGLPESHRLVESQIEQALIDNLQEFLLELGKGFAFISRQERLTLEGDHFYVDLVFYHTILKCYVLIDLKVGKLTHSDLGQLQLYVNYFDQERRTTGDGPTLGLALCTDKNDAVVKYTLGPEQEKKIFASRYKLHLPTVSELKAEIRRELRSLMK